MKCVITSDECVYDENSQFFDDSTKTAMNNGSKNDLPKLSYRCLFCAESSCFGAMVLNGASEA